MTELNEEIILPDLDEDMINELSSLLGTAMAKVTPNKEVSQSREITTIAATVVVSLTALRILAIWIARHTQYNEAEITVQTRRKDGSLKTINFRSRSGSSQSEAEVLKQLAVACKIDLKDIPDSLEVKEI